MTKTINTTTEPASNADQDNCGNCGVALLGPHCHACGQPVKGLVRHFSSIVGDALDTVFDFDTRIVRTIGPLFAKPGYITREYFAGRRVRYVSPVRLFFFLCILVFFVAQVTTDDPTLDLGNGNNAIASATTVGDVERKRDAQLANLAKSKQEMAGTAAAVGIPGIEAGEQSVRETAAARIKQVQEAKAKGLPPPEPMEDDLDLRFGGGERWHVEKNPIDTWLPAFADQWLNEQVERGDHNIGRLNQDPAAFKNAVLSAVPTTLFVLVPIFALMLKLAYVFKRRLYMEHLIVALHSHAFLCLDLLLVLLVRALAQWLAPGEGALATLLSWIEGLLLAWMPIYLLVMQKRVYAQGWPVTLLKYCVLGTCYTILLSFAIISSMAIGLVAM
ncbi:MAG: DUF3667 domain-containing protein [Thermomonas sp.]